MAARVVTFYSCKGGVGRSFALANIAVILADWGCRVLMVDWDIEAPGLNHYFAPYTKDASDGVLDFLADCQKDAPKTWDRYVRRLYLDHCAGELHLMPAAGDQQADYAGLGLGRTLPRPRSWSRARDAARRGLMLSTSSSSTVAPE